MDLLEAERHKMIVDLSTDLLKCLDEEDKAVIEEICSKSKEKVKEFNKENRTVLDITPTEISKSLGRFKITIRNKYINPVVNKIKYPNDYSFVCEDHREYYTKEDRNLGFTTSEWYINPEKVCDSCRVKINKIEEGQMAWHDKTEEIDDAFRKASNNTTYDPDLIKKYVLLNRGGFWSNKSDLKIIIGEAIRLKVLETFFLQNRELINKYN